MPSDASQLDQAHPNPRSRLHVSFSCASYCLTLRRDRGGRKRREGFLPCTRFRWAELFSCISRKVRGSEFVQAVGTLVAAHTLLLDLVKPPLRKWPGGRCPPPTHPQKPLRLPFNPTPLPCSLSSSLSSRWKAWCGQGEAQEQMSAQSDHLEPVAPPHTCCLKAPSLPQTPLHPLSHLSLSRLLPHHSLPPLPHLPPAPLPRCAAAGLGQVDCRGAIPSPHGRRTLTVACRPPASVLPPLVQLARVASVASWSNHPHWQAGDAADGNSFYWLC